MEEVSTALQAMRQRPDDITMAEYNASQKGSEYGKKRVRSIRHQDPNSHLYEQLTPFLIKSKPSDMDLFHLGLQIKYFPLFRILQSATKVVTTEQWKTTWREMKLFRILNKFEQMREQGFASIESDSVIKESDYPTSKIQFRPDSHPWNTLLDEMRWMSVDFHMERTWKQRIAKDISSKISGIKPSSMEGPHSLVPTISTSQQDFEFYHSKNLDTYLTEINPKCPTFGPPNITAENINPLIYHHGLFTWANAPKKHDPSISDNSQSTNSTPVSSHVSPPWSRMEDEFIITMMEDYYHQSSTSDNPSINWSFIADYINTQYHHGQYVRYGGAIKSRYSRLLSSGTHHIKRASPHRMTIEDKKNHIVRQFENLMYSFAIMRKRPRLRTFTKCAPNSQSIPTKKVLLSAHVSHEAAIRKLTTQSLTVRPPVSSEAAPPGQLLTTPEELVIRKIQRARAIMEMHQATTTSQSPRPHVPPSQVPLTTPIQPAYPMTTPPPPQQSTPTMVAANANTPIPGQQQQQPVQPTVIPVQYYQQPGAPGGRPVHPGLIPQGQQPVMLMMVRPHQRPQIIPPGARPIPIIAASPPGPISQDNMPLQQSPITGGQQQQHIPYYHPQRPMLSGVVTPGSQPILVQTLGSSPPNPHPHGPISRQTLSPRPVTPIAPASPAKGEQERK